MGAKLTVVISVVTACFAGLGAAGCGPCLSDFGDCSPRGGVRGVDAAYSAAFESPGGAPIYWLGPTFSTADASGLVAPHPGDVEGALIMQGVKFQGTTLTVFIVTPLPRPSTPAPATYHGGVLLSSLSFPDGGRADLYIDKTNLAKSGPAIRRKIEPLVQPVVVPAGTK